MHGCESSRPVDAAVDHVAGADADVRNRQLLDLVLLRHVDYLLGALRPALDLPDLVVAPHEHLPALQRSAKEAAEH